MDHYFVFEDGVFQFRINEDGNVIRTPVWIQGMGGMNHLPYASRDLISKWISEHNLVLNAFYERKAYVHHHPEYFPDGYVMSVYGPQLVFMIEYDHPKEKTWNYLVHFKYADFMETVILLPNFTEVVRNMIDIWTTPNGAELRRIDIFAHFSHPAYGVSYHYIESIHFEDRVMDVPGANFSAAVNWIIEEKI